MRSWLLFWKVSRGRGLRADICREHQISQTLFYRWRDKFLEGCKRALSNGVSGQSPYKAEIEKLQKIIGKQAIEIEIKKNGGAFHDKVEAVEMLKGQGYSVSDACRGLGILRSGYYYRASGKVVRDKAGDLKDRDLLERTKGVKAEHPFWGYRGGYGRG